MDNNNQPKHPRDIQQPDDITTGGENLNDDSLEEHGPNTTYDLRQAANEAMQMYEQSKQQASDDNGSTSDEADEEVNRMHFDESMSLIFEIVGSSGMLTLDIKQDVIVGRSDTTDNFSAGLDLTQYGAYQLGLSRKHARIRRNGTQLELEDTGSRNGTFVNEQQLDPHVPYVVRDGDMVRFGNMKVQLRFAKKA